MKDIISFELVKKLDEAGVMKDIETEYSWYTHTDEEGQTLSVLKIEPLAGYNRIKAPTLSEAIDILPKRIDDEYNAYYLTMGKGENLFYICYNNESDENIITTINNNFIYGKTLLEAVEKMLEYLLENNLIGNK